jgi:hypothetical protein
LAQSNIGCFGTDFISGDDYSPQTNFPPAFNCSYKFDQTLQRLKVDTGEKPLLKSSINLILVAPSGGLPLSHNWNSLLLLYRHSDGIGNEPKFGGLFNAGTETGAKNGRISMTE